MVKEISLFADILEKTQPILLINELGLEFWHPNALSKKANLESRVNEKQEKRLRSLLQIKTKKLADLEAIELTEENLDATLDQISVLEDEVYELTQKVNGEVFNYIALTAKKPREAIVKQIEAKFKEANIEYDIAQVGNDIYFQILGAAREYNEREKKKIAEILGTNEE